MFPSTLVAALVASTLLAAGFAGYRSESVAELQQEGPPVRPSAAEAVTPQQYLRAGENLSVDAGPAIRRALGSRRPVRFPSGVYVVQGDPASRQNGSYKWSIRIPSGAVLMFEQGAKIRAAAGSSSWNRIVSFEGASGVRSFGVLHVDANVQQARATNEHMHGVFLFNTRNSYFEAIRSENARGDNVYIGGTDNSRGSHDVSIGTIVAESAGRKNLVIQASDDLHIGEAVLDNQRGGARLFKGIPDDTDGNSLDVEPDSFSGAVPNSARIDRLKTIGSGNDFTAGVSQRASEAWKLSIGEFEAQVVPRAGVAPWTQYGITIEVGRLTIHGISALEPQASLLYSGRLLVNTFNLEGNRPGDFLFLVAAVRHHRPILRVETLAVANPSGHGVEVRDGELEAKTFKVASGRISLWARGLSSTPGVVTRVAIGDAYLTDVGSSDNESFALLVSADANPALLNIGRIHHSERRRGTINQLIKVSSRKAQVTVGAYQSASRVPLFRN